jgi:hypothetical protein
MVAGKERLLTLEPMSFQLSTNTDVVRSTKFNTEGQVVIAGTAKRAITSTLTLGVEAVTWMTMQIAHGELSSTSTNLEIPDLKFATLPATGPQTISDAAVVSLAKTTVAVYTDDKAISLSPVTATPSAGQYSVAAGVITIGPGYAGAVIGYRVLAVVPTCESLGVEDGATLLTGFRLDGILKTDSKTSVTRIMIPSLSQENEPSLDIAAPTKMDLTFTLITVAGRPRPYELYNIAI